MHLKSFFRRLRLFTIVVPFIVLAGCWTGDGRGPSKISDAAAPEVELIGRLVNSPVTGAEWETSGGESGLTQNGEYPYMEGDTVTFSVGDIILGVIGVTVEAADLLTPVELTGSNTPLDQAATNMLVFLQTIDENSPNSADGILITAATRDAFAGQSLNFDSDSDSFTDDLQALLDAVLPGKTIVSEQDALGNFCEDTYLPLGGQSTFGYPFPGCEAGGTVELLTNGGFELPDASGGDIACSFSWDCFNSNFTNSNLFDDGNGGPAARTGTQVLKQFDDDGGAFQDVAAAPGSTYTASVWAQNWSGDPLNRLVILQLFFLDGSGNILEQNETFGTPINPPGGMNQTYLPPDTWVQLTVERVAPANTSTARIQVIHLNNDTNQTGNPGGSVFWDDASLTGPGSSPPPTEEELLTNEGFELPDASGGDIACSFSWDCFNSSFTNSNLFDDGNGGPTARSGTQILKQFDNDGGAFQDVPAEPGSTYTASIWAQNWSGDSLNRLVLLQLFFLDSGGNILEQNETFGTPINPPGGMNQTYLPPDTWVELSIQRVAPANTATARIQVIHLNNDTNQTGNPGGAVFWDDASLTGPGTSPPPPPPEQERLTNTGFETPDASGGDVPGAGAPWSSFNSNFTVSNLINDNPPGSFFNPDAHGGTQLLKQFGTDAGSFQDVAATPGETYTASAWAQSWAGDPNNDTGLLQLFFRDDQAGEAGNLCDPGGFNACAEAVFDTSQPLDTWVQLMASAVAPAGTTTARIQLLLVPGPVAPPGPELLTNTGFETPDASGGDVPGAGAPWSSFNSNFTVSNLINNNPPGSFFNPDAHGGTQLLKQFGTDAGSFQDAPATPGETYTASAWAQSWAGDPNNNTGLLQLFFRDDQAGAAGNLCDPGGFEPCDQAVFDTSQPLDTWVQLMASAVAPAGTTTVRIQLILVPDPNTPPGGALFWDDASLKTGSGSQPPPTDGSLFWDDASLIGPPSDIPDGFQLVFSDEFNDPGPVSPDPVKWTAEEGNGPPENNVGFGNNEWQEYTANLENLRVEGGNLVIQARCEITPCISETADPGNGSITSAKIITRDKFEFQYGIVRARIKASGGLAAWPAFWMLGSDFPTTPWPNAGEIDIMELFQNNSSPFETHATIHFCNDETSAPQACVFENGWEFITGSKSAIEKWSDDFHIYELEWTADRTIMRVDGAEVLNVAIDPAFMEEFRKPFYLILNLAMGGNLGPGGNQPPDPNRTFVETSLIDWVRVYQPVP